LGGYQFEFKKISIADDSRIRTCLSGAKGFRSKQFHAKTPQGVTVDDVTRAEVA
jgi:hypothetical protein